MIANLMPDRSRSYVAEMIRTGNIRVNHQTIKPAYKLKAGDKIVGAIPAPEPLTIEAQDIALDIVYEDHDLLVIDKAPGMVVHPAPGHSEGTIVNAILHHCPDLGEIGGKIRPGIVHRLDKDTSGLLVIAKNDMAHQHLAHQFKARTLHKEYLAIVHGNMEKNSGVISLPIGRHPTDRKKNVGYQQQRAECRNFMVGKRAIRKCRSACGYAEDRQNPSDPGAIS
ncbi:MAG: RluA family pseudouridine synthase, partial [Desulfobacteraceae bacterium]|nr:RluA family pseudouridine synthase [Desulfobacteraceae bacterium]